MTVTRIVTDWVTTALIWIYYVFIGTLIVSYSWIEITKPETKSVSYKVRAVYRTFMISQRSKRGRSSKETERVKLKDEHEETALFQSFYKNVKMWKCDHIIHTPSWCS